MRAVVDLCLHLTHLLYHGYGLNVLELLPCRCRRLRLCKVHCLTTAHSYGCAKFYLRPPTYMYQVWSQRRQNDMGKGRHCRLPLRVLEITAVLVSCEIWEGVGLELKCWRVKPCCLIVYLYSGIYISPCSTNFIFGSWCITAGPNHPFVLWCSAGVHWTWKHLPRLSYCC